MLDFQAPVLDHAWAAVFGAHQGGKASVEERRILGVGWCSKARESCVQLLRWKWSKLILRFEIRIHCGSAGKRIPKIRVCQSRVIDAVSATNDGVAELSK